MSGKYTEGSEKYSEGGRMTTIEQASSLLQEIAEPRPVGDTVKAAITRAAKAVNAFLSEPETLSYGRAEDIWRCEARRLDAHEADAIRAAHERRDRALRAELREAALLADRLERLAARAVPFDDPALDAEIRAASHQARRAARRLRRHAPGAERPGVSEGAPPG